MSTKAPSVDHLRSRFDTVTRLVAMVGSRSNSVFSEMFDELTEELRPALAVAFSLKGDTLTLVADYRLGSMVPMPWRRFKVGEPLAQPLLGALRARRPTQLALGAPEVVAAFRPWGRLAAREADVVFVVPAVNHADVLALAVFFFHERSLDEGVGQFLQMGSELLGLALALQGEREREAARSAELAETTRLATLGTLSATVAHELRGPAGALSLLVPELQLALEPASVEALEPLLNDMRTSVERICGLCGQLGNLNYHDKEPEPFDLASVAADVVALARVHAQTAGVSIEEDLAEVSVVGLRDQIGQVILNLALNAIDACREGGAGAAKVVSVTTSLAEGRAVLEVADSGPGLSKDAADRVFQPFFTTKPRGKGTGLGLSVSRDIVNSHRGHIVVGRSRWQGALFRVELPARPGAGAAEVSSRRLPPAARPLPAPAPAPEPPPPPRPSFGSTPDLRRSLTPPVSGPAHLPARPPLGSPPDLPPSRPRIGAALPERPTPRPERLTPRPERLTPRPRPAPASEPPPPASARPADVPAFALRPPLSSPWPPIAPPSVPSHALANPAAPPPPPSRARPGPAPDVAAPTRPGAAFEAAAQPRPGAAPDAPSARPAPEAPSPSRPGSAPEAAPARPGPRPDGPPPTLRVLVVDDDRLLLNTMKRVMRGCDVTTASTIDEARRALASAGAFDLVVTDVNMPGGSGLDLHRQLAVERPALADKLIFLSGGALSPADAEYLYASRCVCLSKPIGHDTLLDAVRRTHAGKAPAQGSLTLRPSGRK
ncbi:MAG TPA: ATP-binding protein [Polyangiaceae bacterium]|nr:ATP-binding protein [Polyangiaceae bacterium]